MTKEDLTPEQLESFKAAMAESRGNIINITASHFFFLVALQVANHFILKSFVQDPNIKFLVIFLTTILVVSSGNRTLRDEADRFSEEARKIIKQ